MSYELIDTRTDPEQMSGIRGLADKRDLDKVPDTALEDFDKRLKGLKNRVIREYNRQAFNILPVDKFTWAHKQKAMEKLGEYTKLWSGEGQMINNNFILVRSDEESK